MNGKKNEQIEQIQEREQKESIPKLQRNTEMWVQKLNFLSQSKNMF